MALELDREECFALYEALDRYLPPLRFEVARTEDREVAHALNLLEEALSRIQARLAVALDKVSGEPLLM
jgi:hypothetical protein